MIKINGTLRNSQVDVPSDLNTNMWHVTNSDAGRADYEPARSNTFEFFVTGLGDLLEGVSDVQAQEVFRFAVAKAPVPHYSIDALAQRRGNTVQKFAGTPSFPDGQLEVYDWIGQGTKSLLMAWQAKACNLETGKTGILTDYKKDAVLVEYSPDHQIVRQWDMYGVWVNAIDEDQYDHSDNISERRLRATIQYDMAKPRTKDI